MNDTTDEARGGVDVALTRQQHRQSFDVCCFCLEAWPCVTIWALDALDQATARVGVLEAALREIEDTSDDFYSELTQERGVRKVPRDLYRVAGSLRVIFDATRAALATPQTAGWAGKPDG